jgi:hypothetical protein
MRALVIAFLGQICLEYEHLPSRCSSICSALANSASISTSAAYQEPPAVQTDHAAKHGGDMFA